MNNDLWSKVDALAAKVADDALVSGDHEGRLDALKALTAYRAASAKGKPPGGDDSNEGKVIDFESMRSAIRGAEQES